MLKRPLHLPRISSKRLEKLKEFEQRVEEMSTNAAAGKSLTVQSANRTDDDLVGRIVSKQV